VYRFKGWKQALSSYGPTAFDLYSPTTYSAVSAHTLRNTTTSPAASAASKLCGCWCCW
jgi:hypothetical protein